MSSCVLILTCDPYLAGIYGRKFERDHWEVVICETLAEAGQKISIKRPDIVLISDECTDDLPTEIVKLRALPTLLQAKIVILAKKARRSMIQSCAKAGADGYLILGHFVPQEAVEKIKKMLKA